MIEGWLISSAEHFWKTVDGELPYPRNIEYIISRGFPLSVITLPHLSVWQVELWFQQQQIPFHFPCHNRSLCGCIVALCGQGLIFVDGYDPEDERRYTIAHEVAHFLVDYLYPRQQALELFGESIRPVLDGKRSPTQIERLDALLEGVKLSTYIDFMPRSIHGNLDQGFILRAEERADRLALELLAPADQILSQLADYSGEATPERVQVARQLLTSVYGLPLAVARQYTTVLLHTRSQASMAQWFGL
jgi:hypothetical protein